jgi:pimeloyl-ACP methyl ester carboxylesterase
MSVLRVDGADLHYRTHGRGPLMLLMSGTACDGRFWLPYQVPEFSRDYTVVAYDQRGTGETTARDADYLTSVLASDAAALIRHLNSGPAVVIGHSMGGRVAQLVALDHGDCVDRLVLASSGASFKAKGGLPPAMCLGIIKKGYENYIRDHSVEIGFSRDFARERPDRVRECVDILLASLPPIETYFAQVIARQQHDTTERLKDIRVPTLVLVGGDETHGASDTTHVQSARLLAEHIPHAEFEILEGQGHFYFFSAPEATHDAIRRFLKKRDDGQRPF